MSDDLVGFSPLQWAVIDNLKWAAAPERWREGIDAGVAAIEERIRNIKQDVGGTFNRRDSRALLCRPNVRSGVVSRIATVDADARIATIPKVPNGGVLVHAESIIDPYGGEWLLRCHYFVADVAAGKSFNHKYALVHINVGGDMPQATIGHALDIGAARWCKENMWVVPFAQHEPSE